MSDRRLSEESENAEDPAFRFRCQCGVFLTIAPFLRGRVVLCPRCKAFLIAATIKDEFGKHLDPFLQLDSERISLRPARVRDWKPLMESHQDERNYRFETSEPNTPKTLRQILRQSSYPKGFRSSQILRFLITEKKGQEAIGTVSLAFSPDYCVANLGILIHFPFQGEGYGKETVRTLIEFAFHKVRVGKIAAACDVENLACRGLFPSLGFSKEGELRDFFRHPRRGWIDACLMALYHPDSPRQYPHSPIL